MSCAPEKPKKTMFGLMRKIILIAVAVILALTIIGYTVLETTPAPIAMFMRKSFENPNITMLAGQEDAESLVRIVKNIQYPSTKKDNYADIYLPKDAQGPFPVVFWVHGGAYVGGDKNDIRNYGVNLALNGYALVSMNYERAPSAKYPSPIVQIGEMYSHLKSIEKEYNLDLSRMAFAGDSAGAHMTSQFLTIQTSPEYAKAMAIAPLVPKQTIKAALLFCGPYDIQRLASIDNGITSYMLGRAAWAYFGTKKWGQDFAEITTMTHHVTKDFPPAFITDGNTASFESDGKELASTLEGLGVSVSSYFIPAETEITAHEYQFRMDTPSGKEAFEKSLAFLKEHV